MSEIRLTFTIRKAKFPLPHHLFRLFLCTLEPIHLVSGKTVSSGFTAAKELRQSRFEEGRRCVLVVTQRLRNVGVGGRCGSWREEVGGIGDRMRGGGRWMLLCPVGDWLGG